MPTTRRRHAITETPPVQEALDALRTETGSDRVDLAELVILGAREKMARLHAEDAERQRLRDELGEMIRTGDLGIDPVAAAEVRKTWIPELFE